MTTDAEHFARVERSLRRFKQVYARWLDDAVGEPDAVLSAYRDYLSSRRAFEERFRHFGGAPRTKCAKST